MLSQAEPAGATAIGATAAPAKPAAQAAGNLRAGFQAVVATDSLRLRGGPAADEPVVDVLDGGTTVDLLSQSADGAWWRVATEANAGHLAADYLEGTGKPAVSRAFDADLPIPFARQLTDIWCDPADIEMWLGYKMGWPAESDYGFQQSVWNWELAHNAGFTVDEWDCSPYAVASAARQWMPDFGFNHFHYNDAMAATRTMAWLIANPAFREPSIVNIWRGDHYILVRGVRADADPASNPAAKILGLWVADPNKGKPSWLGQDRYIPLNRWLGEHFTPVSYLTPGSGRPDDVWQNKYVTIQRDWDMNSPTTGGRANATPANYR